MAATDKTYRSQRTLDIVFGVSCVLMLLSVVWMFAQDYFRSWKTTQRDFREVEVAMAQRDMIQLLPDDATKAEIKEAAKELAKALEARKKAEDAVEEELSPIYTEKVRHEARAQALKADLDSKASLYLIAVEERNNHKEGESLYNVLHQRVLNLDKQVQGLRKEYEAEQKLVDETDAKIAAARAKVADTVKAAVDAESRLKKLTDDFDRFAKLSADKQWYLGDWFRSLPVVDAFASPTRLQQITLEKLPINYNFKYVTRYDRCTTCHQGIDKPTYSKLALRRLTEAPSEDLQKRLTNARELLVERREALPMLEHSFSTSNVPTSLKTVNLTDAQISEYAAHPRLDLFAHPRSKHPAASFGCTICHEGQGSGTSFNDSSHTPDNSDEKKDWEAKGWASNHYWDFPMLPSRFIESSCIKCHHQVTGLLPDGELYEYRETRQVVDGKPVDALEKHAAPGAKVTEGYNLIRENGCFGCHEIHGQKGGQPVGPDLRLEPWPALPLLTAEARAKARADEANPPGTMRKVGPSLRRLSEKTNEDWVRKWINDPRGFRPSTRMPHFYHLANNNEEVLKGTDQEGFPAAEIHAITYYLFRKSDAYLAQVKRYDELNNKPDRKPAENSELAQLQTLLAGPNTDKAKVDGLLTPLTNPEMPAGYTASAERGRKLFSERGCLACHKTEATTKSAGDIPALDSKAEFGPDLTRIALKLGDKPGDEKARRWLIQWIRDPRLHHPRTFMPITHLKVDEAGDIAAWLLAQKPSWDAKEVGDADLDKLKQLARVYLLKSLPRFEVEARLKKDPEALVASQIDAADKKLAEPLDLEGKLKVYIGRKSVSQLGCFGCHDVSGFESTKPIGTPLNDWGKKDAERLAFEDVIAYVKKHSYEVETPKLKGVSQLIKEIKDKETGKVVKTLYPYEKYYLEALKHHDRQGFLQQKLRNPRSFDYDRPRNWDERLRMPQFKFARGHMSASAEENLKIEEAKDDASRQNMIASAKLRTEGEKREGVMTFVLGLFGEPIPLSYLYRPDEDRMALVKGKQVLDKFNCAGCHQVKGGIYEFSTRPVYQDGELQHLSIDALEQGHSTFKRSAKGDITFPDHNAWSAPLSPDPHRVRLHAISTGDLKSSDNPETYSLWLTRAVKFNQIDDLGLPESERAKSALTIPAGNTEIGMPGAQIRFRADAEGGDFVQLLGPYIAQTAKQNGNAEYDSIDKAQAGLPPPLLREGEKVQPAWLFQFLRDPQPIRPLVNNFLRMPRFNMSDDDAMQLVNYFAAADKLSNEGINLDYPYLQIPQRDPEFWDHATRQYTRRLGKEELQKKAATFEAIWKDELKGKLDSLTEQIQAQEKALPNIKDPEEKKTADELLKNLKASLEELKKSDYVKEQRAEWLDQGALATDAYRLIANRKLCLQCHQVRDFQPKPIGPELKNAANRLRPGWTMRWIAAPNRMLVYPGGFISRMPNNFVAGEPKNQETLKGSALQQTKAVRDVLMDYPRVADMPANRHYRP